MQAIVLLWWSVVKKKKKLDPVCADVLVPWLCCYVRAVCGRFWKERRVMLFCIFDVISQWSSYSFCFYSSSHSEMRHSCECVDIFNSYRSGCTGAARKGHECQKDDQELWNVLQSWGSTAEDVTSNNEAQIQFCHHTVLDFHPSSPPGWGREDTLCPLQLRWVIIN